MDVALLEAVVFRQGGRIVGCGVPMLWRDSRVTLSFLGLLILLPQVSQSYLRFEELRSLGKSQVLFLVGLAWKS